LEQLTGLGDLVIAAAAKFDQAESVAERIGQHDDLPPGFGTDIRFGPRSGCEGVRGAESRSPTTTSRWTGVQCRS